MKLESRLLTPEECDNFLSVHLKFVNWKEALRKNRVDFLQAFVKKHLERIGYQNVAAAAFDLKDRDCPTIEQIIQTGLAGKGGMCLELNYFSKILLTSLGFDVFTIAATCVSVAVPNNHCISIVRISPDELYFVDVGQAQPVGEIIPLHNLPFRGQMLTYPYEYRYCEETKEYSRVHIKGKVSAGPFEGKEEDKFMSFNLEPHDFNYFVEPMATIYKTQLYNLRGLFLSKYFDIGEDANGEENENKVTYVMAFGKKIFSGNRNVRNVTKFENYEDMIPQIQKYFPKLTEDMLKKAFPNFVL